MHFHFTLNLALSNSFKFYLPGPPPDPVPGSVSRPGRRQPPGTLRRGALRRVGRLAERARDACRGQLAGTRAERARDRHAGDGLLPALWRDAAPTRRHRDAEHDPEVESTATPEALSLAPGQFGAES